MGGCAILFLLRVRVLDPVPVLADPVRRKIMAAVADLGGATLSNLRRVVRVSYSTLLWHLEKLQMAGLVNHVRFTGEKKRPTIFEIPPSYRDELSNAPKLTMKEARILDMVVLHPGISKKVLCQSPVNTVGNNDLHRLAVRGLILVTRTKDGSHFFPTLRGVTALAARRKKAPGVTTERLMAYGRAASSAQQSGQSGGRASTSEDSPTDSTTVRDATA